MGATLLGIPSIALSQTVNHDGGPIRWSTAEHFAPDLIRRLLTAGWPKNVLINLSIFPNLTKDAIRGVALVRQSYVSQGRGELKEWKIP